MTPQELKNSILQLAIQGKLVEQHPKEGIAGDIIPLCRDDKAHSIREGKYKKEAFRGVITNNDCVPFEIPDSWTWMFISDMSLFQEGPGIMAADFRSAGVPLIRIAGMQSNIVSLDGCNYLDECMVTSKWSHFRLDLGDIVISTSASMGKMAEVNGECVGAIPYTGLIRFKMYGGIDKNYFKWFIKSPCYMKQVDELKAGGTIKHYGPSHLKKMMIPIPPIAEQTRIVAKIEELLPYIDRYEQAWGKLENFNKRFPTDMQKSILQTAIQGKLVEQRSEEGTGEELNKQIQAEKQRLIKAGIIKKEKLLTEITEDEKPFDIPDSWKWVRIGQIFSLQAGKNITSADIYEEKSPEHSFLCYGGNGIRGYVSSNNRSGHYALIGRQGALCGNINFASGDFYATEHAIVVEHFQICDVSWCGYFLRALKLNQYATATAQPGLAVSNIVNVLVPLPPLAEQKRIVAKLEEILPLCEKLKR